MLQNIATRLGIRLLFILCLAVVIRVGGGLFSPHHPKPGTQTVSATDPFGGSDRVPADLVGSGGEDPTSEAKRDEGPEAVSFEPGQPMIDPNPEH
jgi:hypothetical protein